MATHITPQATLRTSMGLPAGRLGMWWLLVSEIVIFGGLLSIYLMLRMVNRQGSNGHNPEQPNTIEKSMG